MQACRSAGRGGRAPGPFPDGQKNTPLVPSAFSRTRLVVGQKGHFSCHQFRDEESSEFVTDPFLSPSHSDALRLFQFLSLPIPLIDGGGPVVRPVRGGDGGKKSIRRRHRDLLSRLWRGATEGERYSSSGNGYLIKSPFSGDDCGVINPSFYSLVIYFPWLKIYSDRIKQVKLFNIMHTNR